MKTFFTSDTHFGHERIIDLCERPFGSVEEMNECLIENWNSVVSDGDLVVHCGDFIMGKFAENINLIDKLNGTIALVPGNHDRMSSAYKTKDRERFTLMYEDRGVMILNEVNEVSIRGRNVTISHYPYFGDSQGEDRFSDLRPVDKGEFLIHGHVHNQWKRLLNMLNVGVDVWNFTPVEMDEVLDWMTPPRGECNTPPLLRSLSICPDVMFVTPIGLGRPTHLM
jgi:calcineurin-like phosphoesterase family protein